MKTQLQIIVLAAGALMAGCAGVTYERPLGRPTAEPQMPAAGPIVPTSTVPQVRTVSRDGSLFQDPPHGWSPWQDDKAHRVGDIVTVRVSINQSAQNTATTDLGRESNIDAGITALFGREAGLWGVGSQDPLNNTTSQQLIKSSSTSTFSGDGSTVRAGKMTADIAALVTHVYPNGTMRISGTQSLLINHENSLLTVDGIVRPSDISFDNVVLSNRIANARIEVAGRGVVSDKQRPGFLMRAFDWLWPF